MKGIMNTKGFSLIETMIAMALMSVIALSFADLAVNMGKLQNFNDFRLSTNALASSLLGNLGNAASCTQGFSGVAFNNSLPASPVIYTMPNKVIGAGTQLPNYKVNIAALNFTNYVLVQTNPDGSKVYFGDLALTTTSTRQVLGTINYTVVVDSVYLTTSGGVLTGCSNALPIATPTIPTPVVTPTPIQTVTPCPTPTPVKSSDPCNH